MTFSLVLTSRPLRDNQPLGSYRRDGKLYVSVKDNWAWRNGAGARMAPSVRFVLCVLAAAERRASCDELFEGLYGDRKDGGPEYDRNSVSQRINRARHVCRLLGLHIETAWGRGWELKESEADEVREAAE